MDENNNLLCFDTCVLLVAAWVKCTARHTLGNKVRWRVTGDNSICLQIGKFVCWLICFSGVWYVKDLAFAEVSTLPHHRIDFGSLFSIGVLDSNKSLDSTRVWFGLASFKEHQKLKETEQMWCDEVAVARCALYLQGNDVRLFLLILFSLSLSLFERCCYINK